MKIRISYSDEEITQAQQAEKILTELLSKRKNVKIKKPEKKEKFFHTYMSV